MKAFFYCVCELITKHLTYYRKLVKTAIPF
jgi:hypothetical protein